MHSVEYHEAVINSFEAFLGNLDKLCLHVHDQLKSYPVWIDNGNGEFISDRDKVIYVLKHITPSMQLSPQETFSCPGSVGGSAETIGLIGCVNNAKDKFKAAVQNFISSCNGNPTKPARNILLAAGYGGIKLLQVYRHIPYINFHPRRIAWTKAKKGGHVIIDTSQASERLSKIGKGEHIDIQLSKLNLLRPDDKLVVYRQLKMCWGINVATFKDENGRSTNHRIREESLPLFYCHNNELPNPIVCYSKKINRGKTGVRKDKRVEELPFLKSIHAYRYKI